MDRGLWPNYSFKVGERCREKRSLGDEETFQWPPPRKRNTVHPCDAAWPPVSKPLNATQIYAQKCTTKPIALKPAIEFCSPNTADEEALCHSRCFTTKKKSWGHILDKILFSGIIHPALFYLRTGVCYIWSYPKSYSTTCSATLIMFLVHTGPFHSLVASHHTWDNKEDLNRSEWVNQVLKQIMV